jgi:hypothetical protein
VDTDSAAPRTKPSSTLALIGKRCPNCDVELHFLDSPAVIVPDDLGELDWDYIKNLSLVSKILAICLKCGFVAVESLTPVEAGEVYAKA